MIRNGPSNLKQSISIIKRNKPFLILLSAFTISALGSNLPAALILYYVEYVLGSKQADLFLFAYFATGILFLPLWIMIANRLGKKITWIFSMTINTLAFLGVFPLGPGDDWIYGLLVVISGIGFGATLAIPSALQADVIDYDELMSGERREGQYVGMWSISKKMSAAIGVGVGLSILGLAGYVPNTEQSDTVKLVIRSFYALVPSVCNLIAILIALFYPLNKELHKQVIATIDELKRGATFAANPLIPSKTINWENVEGRICGKNGSMSQAQA